MKIVSFVALLFFAFGVNAQQTLIEKGQNQINLTPDASIFYDKGQNLSFGQVQKATFTKIGKERISLLDGGNTVWVKIDVKNIDSENTNWVLVCSNQFIEYIDFYAETAQKDKFLQTSLGSFRKRQQMRVLEINPYIELDLSASQSKTIYIKIKTQIGVNYFFELQASEHFNNQYYTRLLLQGIILGLVLLRLFYVLILGFFVVKDKIFKRYSWLLILRSLAYLGFNGVLFWGDTITAGRSTAIVYHALSVGLVLVLEVLLPLKNWNVFTRLFPRCIIIINLLIFPFLIFDYQWYWVLASILLYSCTQVVIISFFVYAIIKKIKFDINYAIPYLLGLATFFLSQLSALGLGLEWARPFATVAFVIEIFIFGLFLGRIITNAEKASANIQNKLDFSLLHANHLEELDKLKTKFFTNISHEFRTPLTLLVGPIEDLKRKYPQEGIIAVMQRNLQRLQTLINQILDISKLEAGEMTVHEQEIDIARFLNQLFASFESLAQSKHITFNHSQSHSTLLGLFDVDKLEKIITNLLSNAFKFTPEHGRVSVRVAPTPQPPEGELKSFALKKFPLWGRGGLFITIQDTGVGIDAKHLEKIFDRFYQAEDGLNTKSHEGTGIGLALVKELVDLLGGSIEVSSQLGQGTTFTLTLPFEPIEKLSDTRAQTEQKTSVPVIFDESETIDETKIEVDGQAIMLVVEDNPDLRHYIASIFENQYQLVLAADGEEGLAKAIACVPDVVISDLMMPRLDGLGFCEKLKNDERINHIPVVMLTAKASLADRLLGLEHGADDYLSKPFNKEELRVRVSNLINQRQKLRQKYASQIIEAAAEVPAKKEPTIDELFVQKAKNVIDKHLAKSTFDVEEFADGMNLSAVQLRRKLKAITDQTVTEFVRNYRLELAAEMLKKGDKTVSEIAYQVGFDSMPYFSKVFQEKYGKTASEWR